MDSPRGRIYLMRALDEGRAQITDSFSEHMFRCLAWLYDGFALLAEGEESRPRVQAGSRL